MSAPVGRCGGLDKRYEPRHARSLRSLALRDVIADGVRSLGSTLRGRRGPGAPPARGEFWALRNVSFTAAPGERPGIIGRITETTSGRIEPEGRAASLLEVGTGFHPELTGRENVCLNGAILGMGLAENESRRRGEELARALRSPGRS